MIGGYSNVLVGEFINHSKKIGFLWKLFLIKTKNYSLFTFDWTMTNEEVFEDLLITTDEIDTNKDSLNEIISGINKFGNQEIRFISSQLLFSLIWKNSTEKNSSIFNSSRSFDIIEAIFNLLLDLNFETNHFIKEFETKKIFCGIELLRTFLMLILYKYSISEIGLKQLFLFNKNFHIFFKNQKDLTSCSSLKYFIEFTTQQFLNLRERYLKIELKPLSLNDIQLNLLKEKKKETLHHICRMIYFNGFEKDSIKLLSDYYMKNNNNIHWNERILECLSNVDGNLIFLDVSKIFQKSIQRLGNSENDYYIIWSILLIKKILNHHLDQLELSNSDFLIFERILFLHKSLINDFTSMSFEISFNICFLMLDLFSILSFSKSMLQFFEEKIIHSISLFCEVETLNQKAFEIFLKLSTHCYHFENVFLKNFLKFLNPTTLKILFQSNFNFEKSDIQIIINTLESGIKDDEITLNCLSSLFIH
jgi:hypothetical protein